MTGAADAPPCLRIRRAPRAALALTIPTFLRDVGRTGVAMRRLARVALSASIRGEVSVRPLASRLLPIPPDEATLGTTIPLVAARLRRAPPVVRSGLRVNVGDAVHAASDGVP